MIKVKQTLNLSERRACRLLGFNRQTIRYVAKKIDDEDALRADIICLASKYMRFGYRRITAKLRDGGKWEVNHKRVFRIWRAEGLQIRSKHKKRSKVYSNDNACAKLKALYTNHIWSYDFMHDKTQKDGVYRILTIMDESSKKCLKLSTGKEFKSSDVINVLSDLFKTEGIPEYIRSDNGSEFRSQIVQEFLGSVGVKPVYIRPGKPWENGIIERLNGTLRDECLNQECFYNQKEAQAVLNEFQKYYNTERPHSSLGYRVPCPEGVY